MHAPSPPAPLRSRSIVALLLATAMLFAALAFVPGASAGASTSSTTAATNVRATATGSSITLSWGAPTSGTPSGYLVGRDGVDSTGYGAWQTPTPLSSSTRTFTLTALLSGTTYHVWVQPVGGPATTLTVTTGTTAASNVAATATSGTVTLTWSTPTAGAPTGYLVGRDGVDTTGYGAWQTPTPLSASTFSFTFTALLAGTTYHVWVQPVGGPSTTVTVTTLAAATTTTTAAPTTTTTTAPAATTTAPSTTTTTNPLGLANRWAVYQDGLTASSVASYEKWLGSPVSVVLRYADETSLPGPAIPGHVSMWSPKWRMDVPTSHAVITAFCQALVNSGQANAIIRPYWEGDGSWMTQWNMASIGASAWISRWRDTVSVCRAVPGQQFRFEWNMNISLSSDFSAWYPGNDVVDIVGMDVYSQYGAPTWLGTMGLNWVKSFAAAHNKPFGFSEYGVFPGINDPLFMQTILPYIEDPHCAYASYFEGTDPGLGITFSLSGGASPQSASLLKAAVAAYPN